MLSLIKNALYRFNIHQKLARRRFEQIDSLVGNSLTQNRPMRVLEVGCHNGRDFARFLKENNAVEITGLDLVDHGIEQTNFTFFQADAEALPFCDKYFDLVVSIGVLEHLSPTEKLCSVVSEIDRVAQNYVIVVPAVSTIIEPHTASFLWQFRPKGGKKAYFDNLNFYSDEAWLSFKGFQCAKIARKWFIPFLISNTYIYKSDSSGNDS